MVMNAILNRKSVRKYSNKPIEDAILNKIVEAGRMAPSWVNVQPWKFIIVKSQQTKDLLCEISGGQQQVKNAQALICCVADLDAWNSRNFGKVLSQKGLDSEVVANIVNSPVLNPSNKGEALTLLRSIEQLTYAVAYMTLAAEEFGVGACIVGAIANELTNTDNDAQGKIKEVLNLNNRQILTDILCLGYPEQAVESVKLRKNLSEVVFVEKIS